MMFSFKQIRRSFSPTAPLLKDNLSEHPTITGKAIEFLLHIFTSMMNIALHIPLTLILKRKFVKNSPSSSGQYYYCPKEEGIKNKFELVGHCMEIGFRIITFLRIQISNDCIVSDYTMVF